MMNNKESQTIQVLLALVKSIDENNREAHSQIISLIREVDSRLCYKIEKMDKRVERHEIKVAQELVTRQVAEELAMTSAAECVRRQFANQEVLRESEIKEARSEAVALATAPSDGRLATRWLGRVSARGIAILASVVGVTLTIILLLEHFSLL